MPRLRDLKHIHSECHGAAVPVSRWREPRGTRTIGQARRKGDQAWFTGVRRRAPRDVGRGPGRLRCGSCEGDGHAERRGATGLGGFLLTLELRRELAEKLSLRAIKGGQNIEA